MPIEDLLKRYGGYSSDSNDLTTDGAAKKNLRSSSRNKGCIYMRQKSTWSLPLMYQYNCEKVDRHDAVANLIKYSNLKPFGWSTTFNKKYI